MKFRFVGGKDAPEWILAEVSVLSKISCVRLKLITRQVINELVGGTLDVEKVSKLIPKDSGFSWSDVKAALAAIAYILKAATRNGVDATVLNAELQQLGLPKENSDGISRPYRIHRERLTAQAGCESLRMPRLLRLDWRVDATLHSSNTGPTTQAAVHVRLGLSHRAEEPPPRVAWLDVESTPLLLAARAQATIDAAAAGAAGAAGRAGDAASPRPGRAASGGSGAAAGLGQKVFRPEAGSDAKAAQDLAVVQLGVRLHGAAGREDRLANLLSPSIGGAGGGAGAGGSAEGQGKGSSSGSGGLVYSAALPPPAPGTEAACTPQLLPSTFLNLSLTPAQAASLLSELRIARQVLAQLEGQGQGQGRP